MLQGTPFSLKHEDYRIILPLGNYPLFDNINPRCCRLPVHTRLHNPLDGDSMLREWRAQDASPLGANGQYFTTHARCRNGQ